MIVVQLNAWEWYNSMDSRNAVGLSGCTVNVREQFKENDKTLFPTLYDKMKEVV